jgi:hypothetical protein
MSYKIVAKYSNELTHSEWLEITNSFNLIFEKDFDIEYFKSKYSFNPLGFSCHGILYCNNKIVGCFTIIPRNYFVHGKEKLIGIGCDAFILEQHRSDAHFLKKMSESVFSKISEFNIYNFISLPTLSTPYKYWKILGKWKDIGVLDYYVFPVNIGKLIFKKSVFKYFSFITVYIISFLFKLFYLKSNKISSRKIHIDINEITKKERFFLDSYKYITLSNNDWACYRIVEEDGLKVAYIIYVNKKSKKNISSIIFKIISNFGLKIDMILYIGNLKKYPINFIKVPEKLHPRKANFIGLCKNKNTQEIFDLNNWDVSLVDFDIR